MRLLYAMSAPASCSMKIQYADAALTDFGTVLAIFDGPQQGAGYETYACYWIWNVPADAAIGMAHITFRIDYLGVTRVESWVDVNIYAP
jgi:hypothetical protein